MATALGPQSWLPIPADSDFSLQNLPLGVASAPGRAPRAFVAVGDWALDLVAAAALDLVPADLAPADLLAQPRLNGYLAAQRHDGYAALREVIGHSLTDPESPLRHHTDGVLVRQAELTLHLPVEVPDYTDFYASEVHATNVGKLFRPDNPLLPNWKHLPVGYHGRASSIVITGTPIHRPTGQRRPNPEAPPVVGPTQRLDFELELAAVIDTPTALGQPVPLAQAEDHIFGFLLLNDWSARDIQAWEYQPLGPFLGKNFGTTVSGWLVPRCALAPFKTLGPPPTEPLLPYLYTDRPGHYDLPLNVALAPAGGPAHTVCQANSRDLYWSFAQMVAHHTVGGCNLRVGDLLASGTVSSPYPGGYGSLLELTEGGRTPLALGTHTRTFVQDGDTVHLSGRAGTPGGYVGFGPCAGVVVG